MFGSQILEVGIGLIFVYYLLSLFCSIINELIARILGLRSGTLIQGIRALVADAETAAVLRPGWSAWFKSWFSRGAWSRWFKKRTDLLHGAPITRALYQHPLISGFYTAALADRNGGRPSYIPADTFVRALLGTLRDQLVPSLTLGEVMDEVQGWKEKELADAKPILLVALFDHVTQGAGSIPLATVIEALQAITDTTLQTAKDELTTTLEKSATGDHKTLPYSDIAAAITALPATVSTAIKATLRRELALQWPLPLSVTDVAEAIQTLKGKIDNKLFDRVRPVLLDRIVKLAGATTPPPITTPITFAEIQRVIASLPDKPYGDLKRALATLANDAQGNLDALRKALADWYDGAMARVSGWYKRKVQLIILVIAFVVAGAMNADTLTLANTLWIDSTLRAAVADSAAQKVRLLTASPSPGASATPSASPCASPSTSPSPAATPAGTGGTASAAPSASPSASPSPSPSPSPLPDAITQLATIQNEIDSLRLPLGWKLPDPSPSPSPSSSPASSPSPAPKVPRDPRLVPDNAADWLAKIFGLSLTALMLTLGAPFWFDLLSKAVNLRATGKPPATTNSQQEESGTGPK